MLCFCLCLNTGSNRLSTGVINHSYAGKIVVGVAYSADANNDGNCRYVEPDKQAIIDLFEPVKAVPFEFEDNLLRGRWWKNCWNVSQVLLAVEQFSF